MSKSREPESSLELLLDTMCNTFGGVMFIAIALVVVLSMMSHIESAEPFKSDYAAMQKQLEKLKQEIEAVSSQNEIREENIRILQNDPRRQQLADILRLEKSIRESEVKIRVVSAENVILRENKKKISVDNDRINAEVLENELKLQKLRMENSKIKEDIARLKEDISKMVTSHISFKTRSFSQKTPYYLIVTGNRIWRVGPEKLSGPPHSDVEYSEQNGSITCRPAPSAPGVPILENGKVSAEAQALLDSIPSDRTPNFSIHSNSMRDFSVLRENMKEKNHPHGINIQIELFGMFRYSYTSKKVDYEEY